MSYIAKVRVKCHVYLYECEGYREDGKVKSKRVPIGKINPKTNLPMYKEEYIKRMKAAGTPIEISDDEPQFSINDIKSSIVKEPGLVELFDKIAVDFGLKKH